GYVHIAVPLQPTRLVPLTQKMELCRRQSTQLSLAAEIALPKLLQMHLRRFHQQLVAEDRAELNATLAADPSAIQFGAHTRHAEDVRRLLPDDQRHAHVPQRLVEDRRTLEENVADHVFELVAVVPALEADVARDAGPVDAGLERGVMQFHDPAPVNIWP